MVTDYFFRLAPFKKDLVADARLFQHILGMCGLFVATAAVLAGNNNMTFKIGVSCVRGDIFYGAVGTAPAVKCHQNSVYWLERTCSHQNRPVCGPD